MKIFYKAPKTDAGWQMAGNKQRETSSADEQEAMVGKQRGMSGNKKQCNKQHNKQRRQRAIPKESREP